MYTLLGPDGLPRASRSPGALGGHRRTKGYGRLDCPAALRWIAKGHYVRHRVFFADEPTALAAGYRPCATCLPERYAAWKAGRMTVELRPRGPFDADHLLAFLAARAVPGVEVVEGRTYRRGGIELDVGARRVTARLSGDVHEAVRAVRRVLDLDADMAAVKRALGPLAAARPGIRNVGAFGAEEIAIRAVVGQQVSVAGARTVLGRLAAEHGEPAEGAPDGITHHFPRAAALAAATSLPMPRARADAVRALADAPEDLEEVRGIGPWTAAYVRMRLGDPDVLLHTDLVVRRQLERLGTTGDEWRPLRSYATHHLWAAAAAYSAG